MDPNATGILAAGWSIEKGRDVSTSSSKQSLADVVRAFTRAEQVTGAGCIVVIISVFLTWKGYGSAYTVSGLHSWGLLTLAIALVSSAFFVARSPFFRNTIALPKLPVADAAVYVIAGLAEAVTAFMFSSHYGAPLGTKLGFYLVLLGAILTGLGGYLVIRGRAGAPAPVSSVEAPPPVSRERPLGGPRSGPRSGSNRPPSADG